MKSTLRTILPCLFLTVATVLLGTVASFARDLTFEERVAAQEAIERVYYSHQIGATKPFEEAVPREAMVEKVRKYLKESVALDRMWRTPLTDRALDNELNRMSLNTRFPDRMKEIYKSLGDDSFLVKECFVRSLLANRLVHHFFDYDERIHGAHRLQAEGLRDRLISGALDIARDHPNRVEMEVTTESLVPEKRAVSSETNSRPPEVSSLKKLELDRDAYARYRSSCPRRLNDIGPVLEEKDAHVIRVVVEEGENRLRVVSYVFPKTSWEEWWSDHRDSFPEADVKTIASDDLPLPPLASLHTDSASCPDRGSWNNGILDDSLIGILTPTAVWTGTEMIVWGHVFGASGAMGARYDPLTDNWFRISNHNGPSGDSHSAIWTGREMIVWGGVTPFDLQNRGTNLGGRYDPNNDTWIPTSTLGAPEGRSWHTAIWTGSKMIVWGGGSLGGDRTNTGGQYDPVDDSWSLTSLVDAPSARSGHTAVWTGHEMIIWGGAETNTGARYDPDLDLWTPTTLVGAPVGRDQHSAIWTGASMVVWGGYYYENGDWVSLPDDIGIYDPRTGSWQDRPRGNGPYGRMGHVAVWTGSAMLIYGGDYGGWRYDLANDLWSPMSDSNQPDTPVATGVWTGEQFIVWGAGKGGRYNPSTDLWTPMASVETPVRRLRGHTAIWTGNVMIIYGGTDVFADGAGYDPLTDSWASTASMPGPRLFHAAVWTGNEIIIWGGETSVGGVLNSGGRYDPIADRWSPMSTQHAPSPRSGLTAVWTGQSMIVWGGFAGGFVATNSGGRYYPDTDTWLNTATEQGPSARFYHSAVWSGERMLVWGGMSIPKWPDSLMFNDGGIYDPVSDSWEPISTAGAPSPRIFHTAVWTGTRMVVWGAEGSGSGNTGGIYDPATNSWRATSLVNAPPVTREHTAVWTGRYMLVWGGRYAQPLNSGGQYDPSLDSWTAITKKDATFPLAGHTAVWTGKEMIVWGESWGGRYSPDDSPDGDSDGYTTCGADCNDRDHSVHPAAAELCNGIDDNCDGNVDEGFRIAMSCTQELNSCHTIEGAIACNTEGNGTECVGTVRLHDVTPPTLTCPADISIECPAADRAIGRAIAVDSCDSTPVITSNVPSVLSLGSYVIQWTATDAAGNRASCQQSVIVQDSTPPSISVAASPNVLWPPNHQMIDIRASVEAADSCSLERIFLSSIVSSESNDAGIRAGGTIRDIRGAEFGASDYEFELRAERNGVGEGRVYEVTYIAVDGAGNRSSASAFVLVPRDLGDVTKRVVPSAENRGAATDIRGDRILGASYYRVAQGNITSRWGAVDVPAVPACSAASSTQGQQDAEIPPLEETVFYMVSYSDGRDSGYGSASAAKPRISTAGGCE